MNIKFEIKGTQAYATNENGVQIILPLSLYPREFVACLESGNANKAKITPSQRAQIDRQCMDCG